MQDNLISAYQRGAELHCVPCTQQEYAGSQCDPMDGCKKDSNGICILQLDTCGNPVRPVSKEELNGLQTNCRECGTRLSEKHVPANLRWTEG